MSDLYDKALAFATKAHKGQKRHQATRCPENCPEDLLGGGNCKVCGGGGWQKLDYITHPIAVAEIAEKLYKEYLSKQNIILRFLDALINKERIARNCEEIKATALLHDVIEDTKYTMLEIYAQGFPFTIGISVLFLSKDDRTSYSEYIRSIIKSYNVDIKVIKLADVTHNLSTWPDEKGSMRDKWELTKWILERELGI